MEYVTSRNTKIFTRLPILPTNSIFIWGLAHYSLMFLMVTVVFALLSSSVSPIRYSFTKLRKKIVLQVQNT